LKKYAAYVASQINLTKEDILLDVCCGNGLLTRFLKHIVNKL
jgi:ubiquinone/menaquinone biosynthesis C-methylase UbiE